MKHGLVTLVLVIAVGTSSLALGHEYRIGNLHIDRPWARPTAGLPRNGAAYMTISNHGEEIDRLVKVHSPVAKLAQLHTHLMESGVMKMRPVRAVEVHPGEPTVFRPGGLHIMLVGLKARLREGERFPLILTFEKAGSIEVQVIVQEAGAIEPSDDHGEGHDHDKTS